MNVIAISMMFGTALSGAIIIIPMSIIMSRMFDISAQFKQKLLPCIQMIGDKKIRKIIEGQLEACSLIRCSIGGLYHMEAQAKLTLLQNMVNGVVWLLVNV